jgi:hypothetical protein
LLSISSLASADDTVPIEERAQAELDTKNFAEACPLLAQIYTVDKRPESLVKLADCYEKAGKLASAYSAYALLVSLPDSPATDALRARARARYAELGPRRSTLTVRLAPELRSTPGLRVRIDGRELPRETWDTPHPHDAGRAVVTAEVPGKKPFSSAVDLAAEGASVVVDVTFDARAETEPQHAPASASNGLARTGAPGAAASSYFVDETTVGPYQVAGIATFATGTATLLTGFVIGLLAAADYNRSAANCYLGICADRAYVSAAEDARAKGDVGTVVGGVGAVLMATGAAFYFFAPRPSRSQDFSVRPAGLGAVGTFR